MELRLFHNEEISRLRSEWSKLERIDPASEPYTKLINLLDRLPVEHLLQLAEANIKFVSVLAKNRIKQ